MNVLIGTPVNKDNYKQNSNFLKFISSLSISETHDNILPDKRVRANFESLINKFKPIEHVGIKDSQIPFSSIILFEAKSKESYNYKLNHL